MKNKLMRLWDRWGFAAVLTLCGVMIGLTAFFTRKPAPVGTPPSVAPYVTPTPAGTPRPVAAGITYQPTPTPVRFLYPAENKVGLPYASDKLVYLPTLGQWGTHEGVDFVGEVGDPVRAIDKGTVTAVYSDPLMGGCVEITHRGGYLSKYFSLESPHVVSVDDVVSRGQIIGTMGSSAICESEEAPHVHFELWLLRKSIDPTEHLTDAG